MKSLTRLIDLMFCASADFHHMHLHVKGEEFDTLHKVFQDYYEEAGDDFDELAEWAIGFGVTLESALEAKDRLGYPCLAEGDIHREKALHLSDSLLVTIIKAFHEVHRYINEDDEECGGCHIGFKNYLEDRMMYWGKQFRYFNNRRK
jgi:DNA-binding ferritin-like protein